MPANPKTSEDTLERADDFKPGPWKNRINVRDRIQRNHTPYEGDASFVAGATERTRKVLDELLPLLAEEREKGVLAALQEPLSILAHPPGISTTTWSSSSACRPIAEPELCY